MLKSSSRLKKRTLKHSHNAKVL